MRNLGSPRVLPTKSIRSARDSQGTERAVTNGTYISLMESGDRTLAGPTVPPGGLYLTRIWYEDERLNE